MAPTLLPASRAHGRCSAKVEAAHSGGREQADVQRNRQAELTHTRTHTHTGTSGEAPRPFSPRGSTCPHVRSPAAHVLWSP